MLTLVGSCRKANQTVAIKNMGGKIEMASTVDYKE
jgi:hypothetical protein